jgi:DNA-binding NarL/FixJ family response regulator
MKLLIVEDNAKMRDMLKELFRTSFEVILECEDGSEALSAFERYLPEWVFMDIKMKEMNGITATKIITEHYPSAKILIVTDYKDEELKRSAMLSGAADYILKENLDKIFDIIKN